jgi:hypothetical protein
MFYATVTTKSDYFPTVINRLVSVMELQCVSCEVGNELLCYFPYFKTIEGL